MGVVEIGNTKYSVSLNKLNYLKSKYQHHKNQIIKESCGQLFIVLGDFVLGYVATQIADSIIQDIENDK